MAPSHEEMLLHFEVERFLTTEASLLDDRRFEEWLGLFHPDVRYLMPIRNNVPSTDVDLESGQDELDVMWLDDDYRTLEQRVQQVMTGVHWAEEPVSRARRIVTNVLVQERGRSAEGQETVGVRSTLLVYRNRGETETTILVGGRTDVLARSSSGLQILRRELLLDQHVLLSKNLAVLF